MIEKPTKRIDFLDKISSIVNDGYITHRDPPCGYDAFDRGYIPGLPEYAYFNEKTFRRLGLSITIDDHRFFEDPRTGSMQHIRVSRPSDRSKVEIRLVNYTKHA